MGNGKRSTLTPAGTLYADKFASAVERLSLTSDSTGDVQQNVCLNSLYVHHMICNVVWWWVEYDLP